MPPRKKQDGPVAVAEQVTATPKPAPKVQKIDILILKIVH